MPIAFNTTKFGNTVTLLGARGPTEALRILDLQLDQIDASEQYKPGAWVLSMQAENSLNQTGAVAVNATIRIGSGGSTVPCAITVIQGTSLQLPASAISVDVNLIASSSVDMRVNAIVQRGFSTHPAHLIQPITLDSATTPQRGVVPNFARGVRLCADFAQGSPWWSNEINWSWGDGFNLVHGRKMREYFNAGKYYPVVPGTVWTINAKPSATQVTYGSFLAELDWEIAL